MILIMVSTLDELLIKRKNRVIENYEKEKTIISSMVIKLNNSCNMKCAYCYVDCKDNGEMIKYESIVRVIEKLINTYCYNKKRPLRIVLHGGEPLLSFDLILKLLRWRNIKNIDNISFSIQTNGILLNNHMIDILKDESVEIGISLDGYDNETNGYRKSINSNGTFILVDKNIDKLRKKNVVIGIGTVVHKLNENHLNEFCDYLVSKGIHNVAFNYLVDTGKAKNKNLATSPELYGNALISLDKYIKQNNIKFYERNTFFIKQGFYHNDRSYMCGRAPCGAGCNTLGLGVSGDIYICDQFVNDNNFKIGNSNNLNILEPRCLENIELVNTFKNIRCSHIEECKYCIFRSYCPMGCPAITYYKTGSLMSKPILCNAYRRIFEYLVIEHK